MPETSNILYWDANVFLSYVNELSDRVNVLEALLSESGRIGGAVKIYTSTVSHVEVAFAASEQSKQALEPDVEQAINALWDDSTTIVSVEYHAGIAQSARSLIRDAITRGWSLKPLDAIHLATAQWLSTSGGLALKEFHTYDKELTKYTSLIGFTICEPYTPQQRMI